MRSNSMEDVRDWLVARTAALSGLDPGAIDGRQPFTRYGLDSRTLTMLAGELSEAGGQPVSPALLWAYPTPNALAGWLTGARSEPQEQHESPVPERQPIAIVGLSCRFPGAPDAAAFWQLLSAGTDALTEPPEGRWAEDGPPRGGFLDRIDEFDPEFFGISPREAPHVDPQQRLMLELMQEALDDAGIPTGTLGGSRTGAFVGAMWSEYGAGIRADPNLVTEHTLAGGDPSIIPARLSYTLGARGPSLLVNTACSSSLVAVHLAAQSLRAGECDIALAGGVSLMLAQDTVHALARLGALAPDGRSKAFDARADGYGRGEGAGMIVLKPLDRALADGNPIHGVLKSSAVNHDGFTNGLTAPSLLAQESLLRNAYRRAGIAPADVGYVEAHGTGTALGDPIEASALGAVLGAGRPHDRLLPIGSVKSAIGHLEPAAGIAGLIKVLLAMRHRTLPPSGQFEQASPHIPFDEWGLRVLSRPEKWQGDAGGRLVAGVSAFGFGGTNCHVVLESGEDAPVHLLPLAADSEDGLRAAARELATPRDRSSLAQLCAAARAKADGAHRLALSVRDHDDLASATEKFLNGYAGAGVSTGEVEGDRPRITFLFGGQGSQWTGMGAWLLREPTFRSAISRCETALRRHVDWSLTRLLTSADERWIERTELAQPAIFAMQVALTDLWRSHGVEPDAVAGMSMGEVAAAHVAGAIGLDDAVLIMCRRSTLAGSLSGHGAMAVLDLSVADANELVSRHGGRVWVAGAAGPESTVVSGDRAAIEAMRDELTARSIASALIRVDYASHCPYVDPVLPDLRAALTDLQPGETRIPFYSSVTGERMDGTHLDAEHWVRTEREPWRFRTTMGWLLGEGSQVFIDVGPHPILTSVVEQNGGTALPTLRRGDRDCSTLIDSLGALYTRGAARPPMPHHGRTELLVLSARSRDSLLASATAMAHELSGDDGTALGDLCYTAAVRRDHHEHRLAVTGSSSKELADSLRATAEGSMPSNTWMGDVEHGERRRIVFVCSGQGSQWVGMGRNLLAEPVFRAAVEECEHWLQPLTQWSLTAELTAPAGRSRLQQTAVAQPALFAIQVGIARLWQAWGLAPDALIGHSVGEVTAAYLAGALSLAESVEVVYHRSRLMQAAAVTGEGGMASVELPAQRLRDILSEYQGELTIGAINDPYSTVVSGSDSALADLLGRLRRDGVAYRELRVGYAFHSARMDPAGRELSQALGMLAPEPNRLPVYSTVSGKLVDGQRFDPDYWGRNVRQTVQFADAMNAAISDGYRVFLEIGPHPVLLENIQRCLAARRIDGHVIGSLRRGEDERSALRRAAGALYAGGCAPDFDRLLDAGRVVSLPAYPWQRKRYWLAADQRTVLSRTAEGHPLLGTGLVSAVEHGTRYWQRTLDPAHLPYLADLTVRGNVVLSAATFAEMALAAAAEAYETTDIAVTDLAFERMLELTEAVAPATQAVISTRDGLFQVFSSRGPDWARHALATAGPDTGEPDVREKPELIGKRCPTHRDGTDHYRVLARAGLDIGAHLRGVSELWFGQDEVLALLIPPQPAHSSGADYRIHPSVLDAGLQALIALCNGSSGSYVVTEIGRLRVYRTPTGPVWAHGRSAGPGGDVYLLDDDGRVLMEAEGVRMRSLPPTEPDPAADCLYTVEWRESPHREPLRKRVGPWVVFADEDRLGTELADELRARDIHCDLVTARITDSTAIGSLRTVLAGPPPAGVVLIGSLGTASARALADALAGMGWRDQPRLWLVTRAAQAVGEDAATVSVDQAPLWGLGRAIGLDHPQLSVTRLDLATRPTPDEAARLVSELLSDERETDVALRPGGRFVARLVRVPDGGERTAELSADGAYLIVCEDAALAESFAGWMTDRGARNVVILDGTGAIRPIGSARVPTIDTRGTDGHEMRRLIAEIESAAGPLCGLIHAGSGDSAWRWHQHTLDRRLDLFVLCSSVASLFGRPGDALDSARLDAIAHHRRGLGLPAMSLHLAQEGTAAHGIADAPAAGLARALDRGVGPELGRLAVMELNLRHWFESFPGAAGAPLFDEIESRAPDIPTAFAARLAATTVSERAALIEEHLTEQLSLTLQRDSANLSRKATFQGMGMGSIMAVELRNRLESTLGIRLSVALLFTYSTIAALAEFIADELAVAHPSARPPEPEPENAPSLAADIDRLSDAEAEAMLLDSIRLVEQDRGND
ncbi:acyltransferase domain-containing protein [Nocardia sp. NBC_00508]|uniref:acyltransferase domain-containing protein n=1 Tax=Nocardia sp. NBC_00508 TaxID=2975992 RepID=UPI002E805871|nr:acyltransferase domain-containing protein [Nocardia sp. NBC_00508]WUD66086.1 acyltransferase domain-containing protein [Nocardia sp. NBC_00508]